MNGAHFANPAKQSSSLVGPTQVVDAVKVMFNFRINHFGLLLGLSLNFGMKRVAESTSSCLRQDHRVSRSLVK